MPHPDTLRHEALGAIQSAATLAALEEVRVAYLGKKGHLTEALKTLGALAPEERRAAGAALNEVKQAVTDAIAARQTFLETQALNERLAKEKVDVTLPPRPESRGRIHPITQVTEELTAIFAELGFAVVEGPEIEDDEHNFTTLNFPPSHPARQMHDTFYLKDAKDAHGEPLLLRTHTSPVQIRAMRGAKPPFRFISPGATYRCDSDATHTPKFHQIEGVVIDRAIHMGHLKGCLYQMVTAFFGLNDVPIRFRPSFFPFTEPSAEVDIGCERSGDSVKVGEGKDWLEIGGCGMIHPNVLKNCGIDPNEWQGFAFGMGIDRLAMLKYGMPDLRAFFDSDLRWLVHYGFGAFEPGFPPLLGEG